MKCRICNTREARKKQRVCCTCTNRKYRNKYPIRYQYMIVQQSAKRRGIKFSISYAYFEKFVIETGYMRTKGIHATSMSIDRIKNEKGYEEGNLQLLTKKDNTTKYNDEHTETCPDWMKPDPKIILPF